MPWRGLVCRGMCKPQSGDSPELAQGLPYKGKSMRNRGVSSPMPFLLIPRSLLRGGFITSISWCKLQWVLIRHHLLEPDDVIVMGGDEVVVTKSGKQTHGLDRFFSLSVWQSRPGAVFSEFIPDQRQTPHLLSGHDGTN